MGVGGPLTAATYLGDNTIPILADLIDHMSGVTGIEMVVDDTALRTSVDAGHHSGGVDVVWMCGHLTMRLLSAGVIHHEIAAAPVFADRREPVYHSVIVTHAAGPPSLGASLRNRLAVNEPESWSGYQGLKSHVEANFPGEWFADQRTTGSHRASIEALAERSCDVASIDVTVWNHLLATEPAAVAGLRIIDRTADWPVPPISLHPNLDAGQRADVKAALCAVGPGDIASLDRIVPTDARPYQVAGM